MSAILPDPEPVATSSCVKICLAGGKFWSPMFAPINGNEAFEFHAGIVAATTSENLSGRLGRAPSWVRFVLERSFPSTAAVGV